MIFGAAAVARNRYAAGSVGTDGRTTRGALTATTIYASVQPVTGRQLERLPEGLRQSVKLMAYTETELRTADQLTQTAADELIYGGETYQVADAKRWDTAGPLPHWEIALVRLAETSGAP